MRATSGQLLIAPNTRFSVGWKIIAISCVLFDVLHIAVSPYLSGKTEKMPLEKLFGTLFLPEEDVCQASSRESSRNVFTLLNKMNEKRYTLSSDCFTTLMQRRTLIAIISKGLSLLLYTVSFLDVFVTFLTGEYENKRGIVLRPKPFFSRWILPGLGLQLIVNPSMHHICSFIKKSISLCIEIGPSKMFHIIFLIWPAITTIFHFSADILNYITMRDNSNVRAKSQIIN